MSNLNAFFTIVAASATSAFAMSFDKLELVTLLSNRNMLVALGVLILGLAGFMYLNCPCCNGSKCSVSSSGKKMKKRSSASSAPARSVSVDRKRNSSTSSVRKSPRKSKASFK